MRNTSAYPLRLPRRVGRVAVEKLAKQEAVNLDQFMATAGAKKLSGMNTAASFTERRERADSRHSARSLPAPAVARPEQETNYRLIEGKGWTIRYPSP